MSYFRVSILGSAPAGEVWSINPVFDPTFELDPPVNQAALDAACDAIAALTPGVTMRGLMSTALAITGAKVEVRSDTNDSLLAISQQVRAATGVGAGAPVRATQNALVLSLRTDVPGASGRGRIYWPAVGEGVLADTRYTPTTVSGFVTDFKTYLNAMRSALATAFVTVGFDLAVRSKATLSTPHVNKIQAGNVGDTQRRRRDKMVEDYTSTTFPT